jgi:hypothetical protein
MRLSEIKRVAKHSKTSRRIFGLGKGMCFWQTLRTDDHICDDVKTTRLICSYTAHGPTETRQRRSLNKNKEWPEAIRVLV